MMKPWTLQERENAQNKHFRQDVLCMSLRKQNIQATRSEPMKVLPSVWVGHSCIGDIAFKNGLDSARQFAKDMGYEGIYL
jgi:hypothetical protein